MIYEITVKKDSVLLKKKGPHWYSVGDWDE